VEYYDEIELTRTNRTHPYDNGYTVEETFLWESAFGVIYQEHPPIDYSGNTSFTLLNRGKGSRPLFSRTLGIHARNVRGRAITHHTPDGPPLEELLSLQTEADERAEYNRLRQKFA
jgi:hypothetical protein